MAAPPGVLSLDALPLATPLPPPAPIQPGSTPTASRVAQNGTSATQAASSSPISIPPQLLSLLKPPNASGQLDLSPFLAPSFDPQEYANRIIDADAASGSDGTRTPKGSRATRQVASSSPLPTASSSHLDVQGDVSLALSRVNLAIDDVAKLIQDEITTHAHSLLSHSSSLLSLSAPVSSLRTDLGSLTSQLSRLDSRVSQPYADLVKSQARLTKLRRADELLARASRFVVLTRRLEAQMRWIEQRSSSAALNTAAASSQDVAKATGAASRSMEEIVEDAEQEREGNDIGALAEAHDSLEEERGRGLARAALSVREINLLLLARPDAEGDSDPASGEAGAAEGLVEDGLADDDTDEASSASDMDISRLTLAPSLDSLDFVRDQLPFIEEARARVTEMMEDLVVRGLRDLSPTLLSTSLQTAFNLGHLPDLVRDLLADLTDVIRERVKAAFDVNAMAKVVSAMEPPSGYASYRSRRTATPMASDGSSQDRSEWSNVVFERLTTLLVGEMGAVCSKVYTLERVLRVKSDVASGRNFLDEALLVLGNKPSFLFWTTLSQSFEAESSAVVKTSSYVHDALTTSFPRLLRIFHEFFSKVSVWTDSVYSHSQQSPETVVLLRSASKLQATYVARSSARLEEVAFSGFSSRGGATGIPNANNGASLAHQVANEIDGARFDPLLLHDVASAVDGAVLGFLRRLEGLVRRRLSSEALSQRLTDDLDMSILSQRATDASAYTLLPSEATRSQSVNAELINAVWHLRAGLERLTDEAPPSTKAMLTRLIERSTTIYKTQLLDPLLSAIRSELHASLARMHLADFTRPHDAVSGSGSAYMSEVADRLWYIREQLLMAPLLVSASEKKSWALLLGGETMVTFLFNASLVRNMGEGGKLKLTSDMTALEWHVSQLVGDVNEEGKREVNRAEAHARRSGNATATSRAPVVLKTSDVKGEAELRAFKRLIYADEEELLGAAALAEGESTLASLLRDKATSSLHALIAAQHLLGRLKPSSSSPSSSSSSSNSGINAKANGKPSPSSTLSTPFEALRLSRNAYVDEACRKCLASAGGDDDDVGIASGTGAAGGAAGDAGVAGAAGAEAASKREGSESETKDVLWGVRAALSTMAQGQVAHDSQRLLRELKMALPTTS